MGVGASPSDDRVFLPLAYDLQRRSLTLSAVAGAAATGDGRNAKRVKALCVGGTKVCARRRDAGVVCYRLTQGQGCGDRSEAAG